MKWLVALLCLVGVTSPSMPITYRNGVCRWQFGAAASYYTVYLGTQPGQTSEVTKSTYKYAYVSQLRQGQRYYLAVTATVNGHETPKSPEITFKVAYQTPKAASLNP